MQRLRFATSGGRSGANEIGNTVSRGGRGDKQRGHVHGMAAFPGQSLELSGGDRTLRVGGAWRVRLPPAARPFLFCRRELWQPADVDRLYRTSAIISLEGRGGGRGAAVVYGNRFCVDLTANIPLQPLGVL